MPLFLSKITSLILLQIHRFALCSSNIQIHSLLWIFENAVPSSPGLCTAHSFSFSQIQFKFLSSESSLLPNHPILCPYHMNWLSTQLIFLIRPAIIWLFFCFITLPISVFPHLPLLDPALSTASRPMPGTIWYLITICWKLMNKQINKLVK